MILYSFELAYQMIKAHMISYIFTELYQPIMQLKSIKNILVLFMILPLCKDPQKSSLGTELDDLLYVPNCQYRFWFYDGCLDPGAWMTSW